jgi:hypothetical protein
MPRALCDRLFIAIRFRPAQLVVEMGDDDGQAKSFLLFGKQVQQYDGVSAPADCGDDLVSLFDQSPSPAELMEPC